MCSLCGHLLHPSKAVYHLFSLGVTVALVASKGIASRSKTPDTVTKEQTSAHRSQKQPMKSQVV